MPTYVNPSKCDGCQKLANPVCAFICPSDVMHLDATTGKAHNIEPDRCWECYACVKVCPQLAIGIRGCADVMPLGASITTQRDSNSITWTVTFRNGEVKQFQYLIRTTPWDSIEVHAGLPSPRFEDLKGPGLCGSGKFPRIAEFPKLAVTHEAE